MRSPIEDCVMLYMSLHLSIAMFVVTIRAVGCRFAICVVTTSFLIFDFVKQVDENSKVQESNGHPAEKGSQRK